MKEKTEREKIESVYTRWCQKYSSDDLKPKMLKQLDLLKVSKKEVDDIIGNTSWTDNICYNCGKHREIVISFSINLFYDEELLLCENCLEAGLKFLKTIKESEKK